MSRRQIILGSFVSLILGAAGGYAAGYFMSKHKYLSMADKEIESVKAMLKRHYGVKKLPANEEPEKKVEVKEEASEDPIKTEYNNYTKQYKLGSTEIAAPNRSIPTPAPKEPKKAPKSKLNFHVLSPEQFDESTNDAVSLIYYSNKVLADTDGNVIHNVNEVIGPEALSAFGRYGDPNCVYVRDESKQIDYEILFDQKPYSQVNLPDEEEYEEPEENDEDLD